MKPWPAMLGFIAGVTALRAAVLAGSQLGFHGDEAQYWSWGQDLAWGYYTKPPMIAWLIRGTTTICGDAEWCARLGSPLLHAGTSILCGLIGRHLYDDRTGLWAGLLYLTLPAVSFSSAIISTDVPLLFFWALSIFAILKILETRSNAWAIVLGAAFGLGLLSKYAMAYFAVGTLLATTIQREHRWFLKSTQALLALALAAALITPNVAWNVANDWATVVHIGQNANLGRQMFNASEAIDFLGAQAGVFGPILFTLLVWRVLMLFRDRPDPREGFLLSYCLPVLIVVTVQAFLSRANANWAATAYISATVVVANWIMLPARLWIAKLSITLHVVAASVMTIFFLGLPGVEPPLKSDPLRRLRGWDLTGTEVISSMQAHPGRILLLDDRKTMASLSYQLRNEPWRPVIWDYDERPDHHFELTARYHPKSGDSVLLVAKWDDPRSILEQFSTAVRIGRIEVPIGAGGDRVLHLFTLDGYVGH